VKEIP
jgi:serine/threonine protein kinase